MTRAEIAALPPGPELDELVSRAVFSRSGRFWKASTELAHFLPLCQASYAAGLGWPVVLTIYDEYTAFLQSDPGKAWIGESVQTVAGSEVSFFSENSEPPICKTPSHAVSLAVALAGNEKP